MKVKTFRVKPRAFRAKVETYHLEMPTCRMTPLEVQGSSSFFAKLDVNRTF